VSAYTLLQFFEVGLFGALLMYGILSHHPSVAVLAGGLLIGKAILNILVPEGRESLPAVDGRLSAGGRLRNPRDHFGEAGQLGEVESGRKSQFDRLIGADLGRQQGRTCGSYTLMVSSKLELDSVTQLIGRTPLVRLHLFERQFPGVAVYAKARMVQSRRLGERPGRPGDDRGRPSGAEP